MTPSDHTPKDAREEVDQLRDRVEALSQPVPPAVASMADRASGVADQATEYAKQAYATVSDQTDWLADRTRQSPVATLAIACVVGYMLGRMVR